VSEISPNTAHFAGNRLAGVNAAYADGHVENHTSSKIKAQDIQGTFYWFY
jgi:prepilin-type processing-associated H-X9-DG protein